MRERPDHSYCAAVTQGTAKRAGLIAVLAMGIVLALAGPAFATGVTRYVAPGGSTSSANDCTDPAHPCALNRAIQDVAQTEDDVSLAAGDYTLTTAITATLNNIAIHIHGPSGTQSARIAANTTGPAISLIGPHIHDLAISQSHADSPALQVDGGFTGSPYGTVENVRVTATGTALGVLLDHSSTAVSIGATALPLLRNSVVTSADAPAVKAIGDAEINGVDAYSSGSNGINVVFPTSGTRTDLIFNTIARGSGPSTDIGLVPLLGGTEQLTIKWCDQRSVADNTSAPFNVSNNITADPQLAGGEDFHQTSLSPTVNAGSSSGAGRVGGTDLDWETRVLGPNPDIGADERPFAPSGEERDATAITSSSATLHAVIDPGSAKTTYHFEYGTTPAASGSSTPPQQTPATSAIQNVTADVTGLTPGTTYYFRVAGSNEAAGFTGPGASFTTPAAAATQPTTVPAADQQPTGLPGAPPGTALGVKLKTTKQKLKSGKLVFTLMSQGPATVTGTAMLGKSMLAKFAKPLVAGPNKVTVKLSKKARATLKRKLRKSKSTSVRLKLTYRDAAGHHSNGTGALVVRR
jgi:hypothetical protein